MEKTLYRRMEQHRDRWSSYGPGTGIDHISAMLTSKELKKYKIFSEFDDKFLAQISPDVSVATWTEGAVLFEEGSFIDVAFFLVSGSVGLSLDRVERQQQSRPIFDASRTILPQTRDAHSDTVLATKSTHHSRATSMTESSMTFLSAMDFNMPRDAVLRLREGEVFGEIGALNGWPQSVTARTLSTSTLVQIRVPALRLMKRRSKAFKERIDSLYRERSLLPQLQTAPLFESCSDDFLSHLALKVELVSCAPNEIVVEEEESADAFYLVRSGFLKLSQKTSGGQTTVSYLSKGMTLGEIELLIEGVNGWTFTASSVGYSELVKLSRKDFSNTLELHPEMEEELWQHVVARIKEAGSSRRHPEQAELLQFTLDEGLVEGSSILAIDLNACTRCDDCVRACADTHGGRPRFVREGTKYQNLLVTNACYHCQDPVCLIGCPTGAIRRANVGDVVEISDEICIGCGTCGNNCPYDAIVMHDTESVWPGDAVPKTLRGQERKVASKCDLCHTSALGPACVRNCPQGCAFRVGSLGEFQALLTKGN